MFTINYNEELSAFYGGTIQQQTDFLAKSVKAILSLYLGYQNQSITHSVSSVQK